MRNGHEAQRGALNPAHASWVSASVFSVSATVRTSLIFKFGMIGILKYPRHAAVPIVLKIPLFIHKRLAGRAKKQDDKAGAFC